MSSTKSFMKPLQPHRVNGRFYFDVNHKPESLFFGTAPRAILSLCKRLIKKRDATIPRDCVVAQSPIMHSVEPVITWIGHATFLIQVAGVNILVDPIWGNASVLYPRTLPPGVRLSDLPRIDMVLLSHNHRDHMDESTLMYLHAHHKGIIFGVPYGDKQWFLRRGITAVQECLWEEQIVFGDGAKNVTAMFVPAHHWSQRNMFDQNKSLWGGWVIQAGSTTIYFAGDTAYSAPCFERIAYLFPRIDCALLPVGPGEPREWMKHTHLDADEAGDAFLLLNAHSMIPMHWGTYTFGYDNFYDPINKLMEWWHANNAAVKDKYLCVPKIGARYSIASFVPVPLSYSGVVRNTEL